MTRSVLMTAAGVSFLGKMTAGRLFESGDCCLILNQEGIVELVPLVELQLDALTEPDALQKLLQAGYTDEQLRDFMVARERRQKPEPGVSQ